jgi:Double zinc ribbon
MTPAIFGISNNGLNLVVTLIILMLIVVWLALIVYTYLDAKRRVADSFLVGCATAGSFLIPYLGTAVYAIVRPPEFLEDAHERELEIKAAELRVRQLSELTCPNCEYPVEKSYLRCPRCKRRLKDPCQSCGKPVDPRWVLCPYCETPLTEREGQRRQRRKPAARKSTPPPSVREPARGPVTEAPTPTAAPNPNRPQRSPSREPNPDPRQA